MNAEQNAREAMEVWWDVQDAYHHHEQSSVDVRDQAAASVIAAKLAEKDAEIVRLRARLEMPEPPFDDDECDGIACRDDTIKLLDDRIAHTLEALDTERAAHEATKAELQALRELATKLHQALAMYTSEGCPRCSGDCSSANPPMYNCPTQAAIEAYRAFDSLTRKDA